MLLGLVLGQGSTEIPECPLLRERPRLEEDDRDFRVANLDASQHVGQETGRRVRVLEQVSIAVFDDDRRTWSLGKLGQLENQRAVVEAAGEVRQ